MMFEFAVPDGDWNYNKGADTGQFKTLVFTEKTKKAAQKVAKDYIRDGVEFTVRPVKEFTFEAEELHDQD